ncbi:hypothetical protein STEG23_024301, partial [Scotinomys teguina]
MEDTSNSNHDDSLDLCYSAIILCTSNCENCSRTPTAFTIHGLATVCTGERGMPSDLSTSTELIRLLNYTGFYVRIASLIYHQDSGSVVGLQKLYFLILSFNCWKNIRAYFHGYYRSIPASVLEDATGRKEQVSKRQKPNTPKQIIRQSKYLHTKSGQ